MKIRKFLFAIVVFSICFIGGCASISSEDAGLQSPCVGIDGSPCVKRPLNKVII